MWNQKQVEKISDLFHSDCVIHAGEESFKGSEQFKQSVEHWQSAFPDLTHEVDQVFYSDEIITIKWHGWGTHQGVFLGMLPTGKKIKYSGISILKISKNKISEAWVSADLQSIISTLKTFSDKVYTEKDFCEDFHGPAGKIYQLVFKSRPTPSSKQMLANSIREIFSTTATEDAPQMIIPPEIMDKVSMQEHFVPGKDGKVRVQVYLPEGYQTTSYPFLIYLHGGGWTCGSSDAPVIDLLTRKIAHTAKVIVISVDYRLAPEYPYPYGLNDSMDTYLWARKEGKKLFNGNSERIAVGGDSAGGNLAPAMVIRARNEKLRLPDACVMLCPLTDFMFEKYPSAQKYGYDGLIYDFAFTSFVRSIYSKFDQWLLPEVSPLYDSLEGFCPTYVLIGERDLLYDENLVFVKKLQEAGGVVEHYVAKEMPHAYYYFLGLTKEEEIAYQNIAAFLRKYLQ